jgi:hypothetical protein
LLESIKNLTEYEEEFEEEDENISKEENKRIKKVNKKVIYEIFLKDKDNIHYYHIDNINKEWEFTEINGSKKNFYFNCSAKGCKGFGMINRIGGIKILKLTKTHNLDYYEHSYYKNNKSIKDLNKGLIKKMNGKKRI